MHHSDDDDLFSFRRASPSGSRVAHLHHPAHSFLPTSRLLHGTFMSHTPRRFLSGIDDDLPFLPPTAMTTATTSASAVSGGGSASVAKRVFATPQPKQHDAHLATPTTVHASAAAEEISVDRELPFTTPDKLGAGTSRESDGYKTATSASKSRSGSTPSTVADASVQRYFTVLRQLQHHNDDSPPLPGTTKAPLSQQKQREASPATATSAAPHHPQSHLIHRKFELLLDRSPEDDDSGSHAVCTIARVVDDAARGHFSSAAEVSSVVNICDAAICHFIAVRTAMSAELDGHRASTAALRSLCAKIHSSLTLTTEIDNGRNRENEQEESEDDDEDEDDSMYDAARDLLKFCDAETQSMLQDALQAAAMCGKRERAAVTTLVRAMVAEAASAVAAAQATSEKAGQLDMPGVAKEVERFTRVETEARAGGNLAHGANSRRELIRYLSAALQSCVADTATTALLTAGGNVPKTQVVDSLLHESLANASRLAATASNQLREKEVTEKASQGKLAQCTATWSSAARDVDSFLEQSDAGIAAVLREMDTLQGKLESLLHQRSNTTRDFLLRTGSVVAQRSELELVASEAVKQAEELRAASAGHQHLLRSLRTMESALPAFRLSVAKRNAAAVLEAREKHVVTAQGGLQVFATLGQIATSWIDVLIKNSARESERIAALEASAKDATLRYHQADKDLFTSQLEEAKARRCANEKEIASLQLMLTEAGVHATALEKIAVVSAASSPADGIAGGVKSTPLKLTTRSVHEVFTPGPMSPPTSLVLVDEQQHQGGDSQKQASSSTEFMLLDLDKLTVDEFVPFFKKSLTTTEKWIGVLRECDIETLGDLREIKGSGVWDTFLMSHPLLKTQIEFLLDDPQRFLD